MSRLKCTLWLVALAGLFGHAAQPPQVLSQTPTPTGVIVGVVTDQATGKPIPDAIVTVTLGASGAAAASVPQRVIADPTGRFAFTALPAGRLVVQAGKAGYEGTASLNVDLRDGERITNATLSLMKLGSISGRVLDDLGDPVVGVNVRVHRRRYEGGRAQLGYGAGLAQTDDRGIYRVAHLSPGEYVVVVHSPQVSVPVSARSEFAGGALFIDVMGMATLSSIYGTQRVGNSLVQSRLGTYYPPDPIDANRGTAYRTTFAPSAAVPAAATVVTLQSGDQRNGVDVQLTLVPTVSVSGSIVGPDGPVPLAALRLMNPSSEFPETPEYSAVATASDATGVFTFLNVPAGTYVLRATKRPLRREGFDESYKLWAEESLTVGDAPVDGVRVTLRKPFVVSGRVEFEGTTLPSADEMSRLKGDQPLLFLAGVGGRSQGNFAKEDASGSFTTGPVPPGRYILVSTIRSTRWYLKSAMWQGNDLTRSPIDLTEDLSGVLATFTDRPGQVAGTVRNAQGSPEKSATVLLFPVDTKAWADFGSFPRQMLRAGASITGMYAFNRVPADDYFLVAVVESPTMPTALDVPGLLSDWLNPAFLRAVSGAAVRVRVTDGETQTMDLKMTSIR